MSPEDAERLKKVHELAAAKTARRNELRYSPEAFRPKRLPKLWIALASLITMIFCLAMEIVCTAVVLIFKPSMALVWMGLFCVGGAAVVAFMRRNYHELLQRRDETRQENWERWLAYEIPELEKPIDWSEFEKRVMMLLRDDPWRNITAMNVMKAPTAGKQVLNESKSMWGKSYCSLCGYAHDNGSHAPSPCKHDGEEVITVDKEGCEVHICVECGASSTFSFEKLDERILKAYMPGIRKQWAVKYLDADYDAYN